MTHFRYYTLPRIRRALSILLLCLGLFSAWLALDTPFPSSSAVLARLNRENYVSGSTLLASGSIQYQEIKGDYVPKNTWWFVGRQGDTVQFYTLQRLAGFLWRPASSMPWQLDLSQQEGPIYCNLFGSRPGLGLGYEATPVVICTDPNVVRVKAQLISLGTSERSDPQAAINSHGVSPAFTQVADGVWVAPSTWVPGPPEDSGSTWLAWSQGYDADGNLVCQDQPIY
ncbi:hypothetical protein B5G34_03925 [Flavonifractor sp. An82]|uniref:hypothetical protein n=1 Tax=Flavonifractor sp. An82 TaxID=1965660 RepID=UPI000B3A310C|nr:hypothetical protein [Flavonifractor sp. An82]OUN23148.1 hypothetical protein B5G34_03925 [Flavonifractor sp. An82]